VRNIFIFLRSYSNLLTFLFLQGLSIYFIVNYNKYHQAAFGNTMNKFTGGINKQYNKAEYYFQLSRTNDSLVSANQMLYNKLRSNFNIQDSGTKSVVIDSVRIDSIVKFRKFNYLSAKVVYNSLNQQSNYIVANGPNVKYFKKGMGVVSINNDVVGVITEVNGDYAVIMSLMHKDSHLNGKLFGGEGQSGTLAWDGTNINVIGLNNIPKSAAVKVGDSVVTNVSAIFPKGLLVGRVQNVKPEKVNNNFKIDLKTSVNFNNIEFIYAIQSADAEPIQQILDQAKINEK
jgi:rod shape-determining protein MreC